MIDRNLRNLAAVLLGSLLALPVLADTRQRWKTPSATP